LNGFFNVIYFYKNYYQSFSENLELKKHFKPLFLILAINISVSVYTLLDTIILGFISTKISVGYYSLSNKLVKIYWTMISAVGMVLIPRFSILLNEKKFIEVKELMTKSLNIVIIFTIPFLFFCVLFAENIILIISGKEYHESYKSLMILSPLPLIIGICNVFGSQFLIPLNKEKYLLYATLIGLCFSLIINIALIPILADVGAAIATLIAELIVCILIVFFSRKYIKIGIDINLLLLTIISCLFTSPIVLYFSKFNLPIVEIIFSIISYFLMFLFLQIIIFKNTFVQNLYLTLTKK
jgi:O-antigen/teichoic acid export membrane protein